MTFVGEFPLREYWLKEYCWWGTIVHCEASCLGTGKLRTLSRKLLWNRFFRSKGYNPNLLECGIWMICGKTFMVCLLTKEPGTNNPEEMFHHSLPLPEVQVVAVQFSKKFSHVKLWKFIMNWTVLWQCHPQFIEFGPWFLWWFFAVSDLVLSIPDYGGTQAGLVWGLQNMKKLLSLQLWISWSWDC